MAMVIRTLYNNQGWRAPCLQPGKDPECWLCFEDNVAIKAPNLTDEVCSGDCWERYICSRYRWGCTPRGRTFGYRAYRGNKVFFIFKQQDGNYTLWGKSLVKSVDTEPLKQGEEGEIGFAFIHFDPFEPLTRDKWVSNLSDIQLVGKRWLRGRYRYIDHEKETYLEQLIEGIVLEPQIEIPVLARPTATIDVSVSLMPNICKKLEDIAGEEGRQVDEVIREAIAEWLKDRR